MNSWRLRRAFSTFSQGLSYPDRECRSTPHYGCCAVNGAGIGCADHTPSMLNVLLLVVHRNRCLYLRGRAPEVYLAAYLRCH